MERDVITLRGNKITTLYSEILEHIECEEEFHSYQDEKSYFKSNIIIGKHRGKDVYLIDNKLYSFEDEHSYTFNTEFCWKLIECSPQCYKKFIDDKFYIKSFLKYKKQI